MIHGFIDGKTRFVVGLRAHSNNRARTVLKLFLDSMAVHGRPSRLRGDHGTENVLSAAWMEEHQGPNRGSYIWGRSANSFSIVIYTTHHKRLVEVYTTLVLNGFGLMSHRGSVGSGRISLMTSKPTTLSMLIALPTYGLYTTCSYQQSTSMPVSGRRIGIPTSCKSKENHRNLPARCSFLACCKMGHVV